MQDWLPQLKNRLQQAWAARSEKSRPLEIQQVRRLGGGRWTEIYKLETSVGSFVAKLSKSVGGGGPWERGAPSPLVAEADGLTLLAQQTAVRIPFVLVHPSAGKQPSAEQVTSEQREERGAESAAQWLVMEWIEQDAGGSGRRDFETRFGQALAQMHCQLAALSKSNPPRYGLDGDNFLGDSPQENAWVQPWPRFWQLRRWEPQLRMAADKGYLAGELRRLSQRLVDRLPELLADADPQPTLIHGDLWSGNFWADSQGRPVLIDPAVYWAPGEAEFGMLTLFGGLSDRFYAAYQEVQPLAGHFRQRWAIYRAYHLLNHWNLFGPSYRSATLDCLRQALG